MGQELAFSRTAGLPLEALGTSRTHFTPRPLRTRWTYKAWRSNLTSITLGACNTCWTCRSRLTISSCFACRTYRSLGSCGTLVTWWPRITLGTSRPIFPPRT